MGKTNLGQFDPLVDEGVDFAIEPLNKFGQFLSTPFDENEQDYNELDGWDPLSI